MWATPFLRLFELLQLNTTDWAHKQQKFTVLGLKVQVKVPAWLGEGPLLCCKLLLVSSRVSDVWLSGSSFVQAQILLIYLSSSSWPTHLIQVLPPNIITLLGLKTLLNVQPMNFGGWKRQKHSEHKSLFSSLLLVITSSVLHPIMTSNIFHQSSPYLAECPPRQRDLL